MKAKQVNEELSDGQKLHILQDSNKLKKKWLPLTREQKIQVLEGMDIATDEAWILSLIEEVKEIA